MKYFVEAGLLLRNPDKPSRPTNSGQTVYQIESSALALVRTFGTKTWAAQLKDYLASRAKIREAIERERKLARIPVKLPSGDTVTLSPGGQNPLIKQIIEEFCPRFAPGATVVYIGDAESKFLHLEAAYLEGLGVVIAPSAKMPDVAVHDTKRNWLLLVMQPETISVAVQAMINLEQSHSGRSLLEKLAKLSEEDIEGLDRLLSEWTVRDALTVLDEIDRHLATIEAIKKLSGESKTDKLHTLHPLVTQARWLFGQDFDSAEYASNVSLQNAVKKVFGERLAADAFLNSRKRPDLVILKDGSLSAVAIDGFDDKGMLLAMKHVLLIELKKGASEIGRNEMHQATDYVQDLLKCGLLDGTPFVDVFVVGHTVGEKV